MSADEFAAWRGSAVRAFAETRVQAGEWAPEEALQRSEAAHAALLPDGLRTPDHTLCVIVDASGRRVGALWWAVDRRGPAPVGFIFDVAIDPPERGAGHGAGALRALEAQMRAAGLAAIRLHVYEDNAVARRLYRRCGFVEAEARGGGLEMIKRLEGDAGG